MGNVNEPVNERGPSAELPRDNHENNAVDPVVPVSLDSDGVPPSSSSIRDESGPADTTRLSSPVLLHDADSHSTAVADSSDIQSSHDGTFNTSTQSSNTSFPISESALPTTFDVSAEISFSNLSELSDYFITPSLTHLGVADQVALPDLSDMPSFTSVTAPAEQSLHPSHSRSSTLPPICLAKDAVGSDCGMSLTSGTLAICEEAIDAGASRPSDRVLDFSAASLAPSAVHGTSVAIHKNLLIMQSSALTAEPIGPAFHASAMATHASYQHPRENLAPIDNVVTVISDAVPTKAISQMSADKNAILASIPLAATYAEAANLAAQHPELAKELLSRPLLAPPQSRAPAVPAISYAALDSATRSRDHRRTLRRGARNDRSHSHSLSRPARESEEYLESRYMQDEHGGSRHRFSQDSRRGRLDLPPHLDRERRPRHKTNTGDSSQTRWQDSQTCAQAVSHEPRYEPLGTDDWRPSHDTWVSKTQQQFSPKDEFLSLVPLHDSQVSDRSNADEWAPPHDPWLSGAQRQDGSRYQAFREHLAIPDETMHVDETGVTDEWAHSHDPWVSGNQHQSSSHIQTISDTIRNTDASTQQFNADEWRPAHDPWVAEKASTKSGELPSLHSPVSHNVASKTYASDVTNDQWQAPHDPWLTGQPVINNTISKQFRQPPPSVMQREYPIHIHSQPIASILSQSDSLGGGNRNSDVNSPDPYCIARKQQVAGITLAARRYLRNEPESERFSSVDTRGAGQVRLDSVPPEEPRSVSSPPRIVAHLGNEERRHSTECDEARPPMLAMVSTRTLNAREDVHSSTSSLANFRGSGGPSRDVSSRDAHLRAKNVALISERNPHISRTMPMDSGNPAPNSNLCPSPPPDVNWLTHDVTRDATLRHINSLHSNANDRLPIPLASISQNDLASQALQYSTSSNLYPRAETAVHLQLGFDPRAEDWLANPGGRGRGPVDESYNPSHAHLRHSLPARTKINSSMHTFGLRDMHSYEPEVIDPMKEPVQIAAADRCAYGLRPGSDSDSTSIRHTYNQR